jgi:hypothetical protein
MSKQDNPFPKISCVAPSSSKLPANLNEVFADAVAEHLKEHANDGMALFVFGTPNSSGSQLHLYPISTVNEDMAFHIAQTLHEKRGLPASCEWSLFFNYPNEAAAGRSDSVM